jgi:hypothetical protein
MESGASDNALINMFVQYGVSGSIVVLAILFLCCSFLEIVFHVLSIQSNGAISMFDRNTRSDLANPCGEPWQSANRRERTLTQFRP